MEIIVGKNAGFCYGVKRAVEGAKEIIEEEKEGVYGFGEIVHNKDVVNQLANKGIKFIDDIEEAKGTIIIRAHGVPKNIYEIAEKKHLTIKDFTCPKVIKIHEIAEEYANKGYFIILTGTAKHPENIGTISFCGEKHIIIEKPEEIEIALKKIKDEKSKKILLISQTTYNVEKFNIINGKLKELLPENVELLVKNTICATTKARQDETTQMSKETDAMIIIGGKNSSNTKKLFEVASKYCNNCICIENEKELDVNKYKNINKIGIMAGASTPQEIIENVKNKLQNY